MTGRDAHLSAPSPFALAACATTALLLAACATAQEGSRAKTLADASPEPSAEVTPPTARADDILSLLALVFPGFPESSEGNQIMDVKIGRNPVSGAYQATVVRAGLLDDSIAQTKDELVFTYDGHWSVANRRQWRKCYRTGMFEWTTKPCP